MIEQGSLALEQALQSLMDGGWLTEELIAGIVVAVAGIFALMVVCGILIIVAKWRILTKAGEKGWKALIPFYGDHVFFSVIWNPVLYWVIVATAVVESMLIGLTAWPAILLSTLCTIAQLVISVMSDLKLARAFGRGDGFAVGLIFLPTIFSLILAFGKAQYIGKDGKPAQLAE